MYTNTNGGTAVSLESKELLALVELYRVAQSRLSMAERLYFDGLLGRFDAELKAQEADQLNQLKRFEEAMQQPRPGGTSPDV